MHFRRAFLAGATLVAVLWAPSLANAGRINISEVKGGVWAHDITKNNNQSNSIDLNLELVFGATNPLDFKNFTLNFILNPRAIIGGVFNVEGDTHQAYVALDWMYQFDGGIFLEGSFGGVAHTGNLTQATEACPAGTTCTLAGNRRFVDTREPTLGSSVLFREHAEIGYRMDSGWTVSVIGAHISNAGFDGDNDGMDFLGVRFGFDFRHKSR